MGTNYYLISKDKFKTCEHCGTGNALNERYHIGKSSYGWAFSLHCIEELYLTDWGSWEFFIKSKEDTHKIVDEYDRDVNISDLRRTVLNRPLGYERHLVDNEHCIGWGDGSYDLIKGEFS